MAQSPRPGKSVRFSARLAASRLLALTEHEGFDASALALAEESAGIGVWAIDLTTGLLRATAQFFRIMGLEPKGEPVPLEVVRALRHPDDRERVVAGFRAALETGADSYEIEYRIVRPDGELRWIFGRGRVTRDASGKPVRYSGVDLDITERKRVEEALRESEQRHRALVSILTDVPWTTDPAGELLVPQPALEAFTGTTADQNRGFGWANTLHPDDRERVAELWKRACETHSRYESDGRIWHAASNSYHYFRSRATPLFNPDGSIKEWVGALTDVHEQKLAQEALRESEEALRQADRHKDEFLAMLAHEVRGPLAPLRHALEIMRRTDGDAELRRELRETMQRQLAQLARLVEDLLDASRISRGKLELRKEPVELEPALRIAVESVRPLAEARKHELAVSLPQERIRLDADQARLAQVFGNLLNNACKYTEPGGRISLTAERRGGDVVVSVKDNGIGIPPAMIPRIFEMFTQVDQSLERAVGGLGIGLAVARQLVELHGGTIEATSAGPVQGSEFVVRLPVLVDEPQREQARAESPVTASVRAHRILVADDNQDSARSLAMLLKLSGNETQVAFDGLQAIEAAEWFRPHVILLDVGMPHLNGYDAARHIRAQPWGKDTLLVALTGWGQDQDVRRSKEAGFDQHFVKPVDYEALSRILASALE